MSWKKRKLGKYLVKLSLVRISRLLLHSGRYDWVIIETRGNMAGMSPSFANKNSRCRVNSTSPLKSARYNCHGLLLTPWGEPLLRFEGIAAEGDYSTLWNGRGNGKVARITLQCTSIKKNTRKRIMVVFHSYFYAKYGFKLLHHLIILRKFKFKFKK